MSLPEPVDSRGRPLHGSALESARVAAERRSQAERYLGEFAAVARTLIAVCARLLGPPGPDALRAVVGRADALALLRLAGLDTERIAGTWAESEPAVRQVSKASPGMGYDRDPLHHPAVVEAILRGATGAEINRLIDVAVAELAEAAQVGPPGSYPEPTDTGVAGVNYTRIGNQKVPVQRSDRTPEQMQQWWLADPAHSPDALARAAARERPVTGFVTVCAHSGQPGKFCGRCGAPVRATVSISTEA